MSLESKIDEFQSDFNTTLKNLDLKKVESLYKKLISLRKNQGRLFLAGMGGSAANASHATNDFRKICDINTICLNDNISELTARINDENPEDIFANILSGHNPNNEDLVMVFSVGGGSRKNNTSINLFELLKYAKSEGLTTCSIVGKSKCLVEEVSDIFITFNLDKLLNITPIAETMQVYLWHFLCSYEKLKTNNTKW